MLFLTVKRDQDKISSLTYKKKKAFNDSTIFLNLFSAIKKREYCFYFKKLIRNYWLLVI
ncbi:conserved hypothetical protein [Oenococcus oeni]|nr:conserved hypothetical protein [Oenococcus oeni]